MSDTTIIQNGTNVKATAEFISELKNGDRAQIIAAEILQDSDSHALFTLKLLGCEGFFPDSRMISVSNLADFYGLTDKYIKGVLTNRRINTRTFPHDIDIVGIPASFSMPYSQINDWEMVMNDRTRKEMIAKNKNTGEEFIVAHQWADRFISARLALAIAALMFYGRVIVPDSVADRVLKALDMSEYARNADKILEARAKAAKKVAEANARKEEELKKSEQNSGEVEISADGKVTMSADVLTSIVSKSVKDALEAYLNNAKLACANFKAAQEKPVQTKKIATDEAEERLCDVTFYKFEYYDRTRHLYAYNDVGHRKRVSAKTLEKLRAKEIAEGIIHDPATARVAKVPEKYAPANKI